ncbi:MAG: leucyl/phenylalanyl-tRNA--protein transferase, partial [Pseudomonadota bacterium]
MALSDNIVCYPPRSRVRDHRTGRWPVADESWSAWARRLALAGLYAIKPGHLRALPRLAAWQLQSLLPSRNGPQIPDPSERLPGPECLAGYLQSLDPDHVFQGLRAGMHLSGHVMPPKWLAPVDRCILQPKNLRIEKNLARLLRQERFRMTIDRDPLGVLYGCAAPRKGRVPLTWLHPGMIKLQLNLYDAHIMHSLEVWNDEGELVGGLFGYAVDDLFMIESQFHTVRDTSKVATVGLLAHLDMWGFAGADGDFMT